MSSYLFDKYDSQWLKMSEVVMVVAGVVMAICEVTGKGLQFSKFADKNKDHQVSSKRGMLIKNVPPLLIAVGFLLTKLGYIDPVDMLYKLHLSGWASHITFHRDWDRRLRMLAAALTIHFGKRVLEVLFLHVYSGTIHVIQATMLSIAYAIVVVNLLYAQELSSNLSPPAVNLKWMGLYTFVVGIIGNFYHHRKLAGFRKEGSSAFFVRRLIAHTNYVIPHGGLFEYLVCPHYVFEMIDFIGIAMICQTSLALCTGIFVICNLTGRLVATKEWYKKKFDGFPESRKYIIPFIF